VKRVCYLILFWQHASASKKERTVGIIQNILTSFSNKKGYKYQRSNIKLLATCAEKICRSFYDGNNADRLLNSHV